MRINNNLMAMNTHRQLGVANAGGAKSMEKLSSGLRINRAGDDAAGLAISEKMRGQIRGLNQSSKNAQDGISFIQTAEGALGETHAILQRMRELAVQSATDTNIDVDRSEIQKEVDQLASELTRISNNTEFNQQTLLNGGITADGKGSVKFHIGANEGQDVELSIGAMDAKSLGVARDLTKGNLSNNKKIEDIKFDTKEVGKNVVDKANLTITATVTAGTVGTTAATAGVTLTTTDNTDAYNGYTVNFVHAGATGAATASIDDKQRVITINVFNDHKTVSDINGAITANNDLKGKFIVTGDSTLTTGTASGSIGSGGKDSVDVKISNGTAGDDETVTIKSDATKVAFTGANYKGITLDLKAGSNGLLTANATPGTAGSAATDLAGTISVVKTDAKAAQFTNKDLTDKAVAEAGINVSDQASASEAITTIQKAIETVSAERSKLGAMQNRLDHTIKNLDTSSENLQASEARIRDVDMAKEMMEQTKQNILQQASTAMLAQANQAPQQVLQLLR